MKHSNFDLVKMLFGFTNSLAKNVKLDYQIKNNGESTVRGLYLASSVKMGELIVSKVPPLASFSSSLSTSPTATCSICHASFSTCDMCLKASEDYDEDFKLYAKDLLAFHALLLSADKRDSSSSSSYASLIALLAFRCVWERKNQFTNTFLLLKDVLAFPLDTTKTKNTTKSVPSALSMQLEGQSRWVGQLLMRAGYEKQARELGIVTITHDVRTNNNTNTNTNNNNNCSSNAAAAWYTKTWGVLSLNALRSPAGLALYPFPSLMNHSCNPSGNVVGEVGVGRDG